MFLSEKPNSYGTIVTSSDKFPFYQLASLYTGGVTLQRVYARFVIRSHVPYFDPFIGWTTDQSFVLDTKTGYYIRMFVDHLFLFSRTKIPYSDRCVFRTAEQSRSI